MNINLEGSEEVNLVRDARAKSNVCYKCSEVGHFQRDCKYDGDKPTDSQQALRGQSPLDSYNPVVGKWMTNLIATAPITVKAMKNLYAELNRQKDLKRTYCKKYKDLQVVVTTADHKVSLQQPTVITSTKAKTNPQVLKVAPGGKNRGAIGKGKGAKPLNKGKGNAVKPTTPTASMSAHPTANTRDKNKDPVVVTITMLQDRMDELQAVEQESPSDHNSEVTQGRTLAVVQVNNTLTP